MGTLRSNINVRVLGIHWRDGRLLAAEVRDSLGQVVGVRPLGRTVEFGESSEAAVKREFLEELGLEIEVLSGPLVLENIYVFEGENGHEVFFIFEIAFPSADLSVVTASRSFLMLFGVTDIEVSGKRLSELGQGQWDVEALQKLLKRVVPQEEVVNDFLLEDEFSGVGRKVFKINARKVFRPGNHMTRLLVVFEDATDAVMADRHRDVLAAELAHRIKNSLQIISAFVSFEMRRAATPCIDGYRAMQGRISAVAELYDLIARSTAFGPVDVRKYLRHKLQRSVQPRWPRRSDHHAG